MTETVTEAMYTRAFIYVSAMFTTGVVLVFIGVGVIGLSNDPTTTIGGCITAALGLLFMSDCKAAIDRGICYRVWNVVGKEPPFTLDDVDTDEFVDGPVEVEVNDD